MDSPVSDTQSISPPSNTTTTTNAHYAPPHPSRLARFNPKPRTGTKSTLQAYTGWEQSSCKRRPYHQYVHDLVYGGWDNLKTLDNYLCTDIEDQELVISVLDITTDFQRRQWPEIHDRAVLKKFLDEQKTNRRDVKVRLYMAEQRGDLAAGVMEAFGSGLDLDARFFQWSLRDSKRVLSPSEHHRAPFVSIGFGVPKVQTPSRTDAEKFKVTVYVKADEEGDGWTGIFLFSSHTKIDLSSRNLTSPPSFNSPRPTPITLTPKSFREIYMDSFPYIDLAHATSSPFYTISYLLRLNCTMWGRVITSIRDEDRRINGISDTSVGHAEEIQKSLSLVQQGGSLGWQGGDTKLTVEVRQKLEEDFKHLVRETDYMWQARDKMASIRQKKSETRWTTLTNTFTYVFAPITIISGVYGMNVSEISGSNTNPNIWQFFVAVVALNFVILLTLAFSNWVHIIRKHERKAGAKEVFGFAVGKVNH